MSSTFYIRSSPTGGFVISTDTDNVPMCLTFDNITCESYSTLSEAQAVQTQVDANSNNYTFIRMCPDNTCQLSAFPIAQSTKLQSIRAQQSLQSSNAYIGCFNDTTEVHANLPPWGSGPRALPNRIPGFHTVEQCYDAVKKVAPTAAYYGLQWNEGHGGFKAQCWYGNSTSQYNRYGPAGNCITGFDGKLGSHWSNAVYNANVPPPVRSDPPNYIGCFNDTSPNAEPIPSWGRGSRALPNRIPGTFTVRSCHDAVKQVAPNARYYGLQWREGVKDGATAQCWYGNSTSKYDMYGTSTNCTFGLDGRLGGSWTNAVYDANILPSPIRTCSASETSQVEHQDLLQKLQSRVIKGRQLLNQFDPQDIERSPQLKPLQITLNNLSTQLSNMSSPTTTCCPTGTFPKPTSQGTCCAGSKDRFECVCGLQNGVVTYPYLDTKGKVQCNPGYGCMYQSYNTGIGQMSNAGVLTCTCSRQSSWNPVTMRCETTDTYTCPTHPLKFTLSNSSVCYDCIRTNGYGDLLRDTSIMNFRTDTGNVITREDIIARTTQHIRVLPRWPVSRVQIKFVSRNATIHWFIARQLRENSLLTNADMTIERTVTSTSSRSPLSSNILSPTGINSDAIYGEVSVIYWMTQPTVLSSITIPSTARYMTSLVPPGTGEMILTGSNPALTVTIPLQDITTSTRTYLPSDIVHVNHACIIPAPHLHGTNKLTYCSIPTRVIDLSGTSTLNNVIEITSKNNAEPLLKLCALKTVNSTGSVQNRISFSKYQHRDMLDTYSYYDVLTVDVDLVRTYQSIRIRRAIGVTVKFNDSVVSQSDYAIGKNTSLLTFLDGFCVQRGYTNINPFRPSYAPWTVATPLCFPLRWYTHPILIPTDPTTRKRIMDVVTPLGFTIRNNYLDIPHSVLPRINSIELTNVVDLDVRPVESPTCMVTYSDGVIDTISNEFVWLGFCIPGEPGDTDSPKPLLWQPWVTNVSRVYLPDNNYTPECKVRIYILRYPPLRVYEIIETTITSSSWNPTTYFNNITARDPSVIYDKHGNPILPSSPTVPSYVDLFGNHSSIPESSNANKPRPVFLVGMRYRYVDATVDNNIIVI